MNALCFVFSVKFCISKRDFVKAFKPYDIKDVLEQYAAGHADMLAKIRIMDNRLEKIQSNSISAKGQHEIRLRFLTQLTKLEYEMQKIQITLNDLMHYQVNSRLIIENLLKYILDQQSTLRCFSKNRCRFDMNQTMNVCNVCSNTNNRTTQLLSQFHKLNFADKLEKIFQTYNQDVLLHVIGNNNNNNNQCHSHFCSNSQQQINHAQQQQTQRRLSF